MATTEFVRAYPGGTGGYKLGANYSPGVVPQVEAAKLGYDQILWLFGSDDQLTEVSQASMSYFDAEAVLNRWPTGGNYESFYWYAIPIIALKDRFNIDSCLNST